jgi:hypothetical protein
MQTYARKYKKRDREKNLIIQEIYAKIQTP